MPCRGLEALALHVEHDRRSLEGEQVRDDEAAGLAPPRGRDDQGMGINLGGEEPTGAARPSELAEEKAGAGLPEEAVALHVARGLPAGRAELRQCLVREDGAQQDGCERAAAHDEVDHRELVGGVVGQRGVLSGEEEEVDLGPEAGAREGEVGRGEDVSNGRAEDGEGEDRRRRPAPTHGWFPSPRAPGVAKPLRLGLLVHDLGQHAVPRRAPGGVGVGFEVRLGEVEAIEPVVVALREGVRVAGAQALQGGLVELRLDLLSEGARFALGPEGSGGGIVPHPLEQLVAH